MVKIEFSRCSAPPSHLLLSREEAIHGLATLGGDDCTSEIWSAWLRPHKRTIRWSPRQICDPTRKLIASFRRARLHVRWTYVAFVDSEQAEEAPILCLLACGSKKKKTSVRRGPRSCGFCVFMLSMLGRLVWGFLVFFLHLLPSQSFRQEFHHPRPLLLEREREKASSIKSRPLLEVMQLSLTRQSNHQTLSYVSILYPFSPIVCSSSFSRQFGELSYLLSPRRCRVLFSLPLLLNRHYKRQLGLASSRICPSRCLH